MWTSGITQGLMWRATDVSGNLQYPNFVETINAIRPMYVMRLVGGSLYLVGMILMAVNLGRTAILGKAVDGEADIVVDVDEPVAKPWSDILFGKPVFLVGFVAVVIAIMAVVKNEASIVFACLAVTVAIFGTIALRLTADRTRPAWHRLLEGRALLFTCFTVLAVLAGGLAEIIPMLLVTPTDPAVTSQTRPLRPLELEGRDIYIREGCYNCHSQMIRPFVFESKRYGDPSTMEESIYDHPFQWGSKRTGPDLAREGAKYSNLWHFRHLVDPRSVSAGSNMPPFPALASERIDFSRTRNKLRALQSVGVPYSYQDISTASSDEEGQSASIASGLRDEGIASVDSHSGIVALIAYLQHLGIRPDPAQVRVRDAVKP
jgi:cytochrome c oxidase cbb3-type subunit I/II